ncbi:hypothetical protein Stsp02_62340 [Streptomyces sp. NBRC 14336]|jgi:hypothetical protein|uniref:hypothetical protein n=1 Tax=Streptomyces sp. NBRC 14336 TaxID=3030992 RepID=UPI0024A499B2|nr:hypothetical protein [Streptomyces sp. NBRC 14336]WBO79250.1 hypothetical protein SBE_002940 [Streptomyces sp. SBE_14.2]GLW50573.1 hypothetical protein Stsp02_62340 [Streptomyces sp. NBRC 14336]
MARSSARVLVGPVVALGVLAAVSGCGSGGAKGGAEESAAPRPARSAPPSPVSAPALTEAQAHAALITEQDLGEPWSATQGAATWRDGMLKTTVEQQDCRRLMDALYTEEFFGPEVRPRAVTGLDDDWDGAQIRYQVLAHTPRDVDRTLEWLASLPSKCAEFTAVTATGARQHAWVSEFELPEAGDARQGLRITLTAPGDEEAEDGGETTLTLDLVAVRVGEDALVFTNGGLGEVPEEATWATADIGARRLEEVRKQGRAQV